MARRRDRIVCIMRIVRIIHHSCLYITRLLRFDENLEFVDRPSAISRTLFDAPDLTYHTTIAAGPRSSTPHALFISLSDLDIKLLCQLLVQLVERGLRIIRARHQLLLIATIHPASHPSGSNAIRPGRAWLGIPFKTRSTLFTPAHSTTDTAILSSIDPRSETPLHPNSTSRRRSFSVIEPGTRNLDGSTDPDSFSSPFPLPLVLLSFKPPRSSALLQPRHRPLQTLPDWNIASTLPVIVW